ncbi:neurogenic locus Notch protein-like [Centruroides vittatus]|uniref:neurogenic locus Notch protein-like n=1 Tax=Centruroides vittatus TaxID=120091 RepID=UPI00350E8FBB
MAKLWKLCVKIDDKDHALFIYLIINYIEIFRISNANYFNRTFKEWNENSFYPGRKYESSKKFYQAKHLCKKNQCENGGTCRDTSKGYKCLCRPEFSGHNCSVWRFARPIDDCPLKCWNEGHCVSENRTFRCKMYGYIYTIVSTFVMLDGNIRIIALLAKCLNGGICNTRLTVAECRCIEGFRGEFCEENIDDCESHQCQNGGTCIDRIQKYSCCCSPGYTGLYCEKKLTCFRNDCKNGGTCIVLGRSEKCVCLKGFEGKRCEINNQCRKNPCLNKGICVPSFPRYQCKCQPEFTGRKCAKQKRMLYALKFQPKSNHLVKIKDIPPLRQMTMSLFVKFPNSGISKKQGTIFSMKFEDKHFYISEGFALTGFPSVSLIAFKRTFAITYARSDFWHSFVLIWDGTIDKIYVYWDGIEVAKEKTFQSKRITKLNSTLAIGQNIIIRAASEPFVGAISQVNIWDTMLPKEFVSKKKCGLMGNVLSWDAFQSNIHGDVGIEQYVDLCKGKHCNETECYCYKQNLTEYETCLKHLDLCSSFLCLNGRCVNEKMCECREGFYGKFCQHHKDKCLINNGGCSHSCKSLFGNVTCTCPPKMRLLSDEKTCAETERCVRGNKIYMNGDTWEEGCQTCICYFTVLRCFKISCPKLKCRGPSTYDKESCGKVLTVDSRTEMPTGHGQDYTQESDYYDYVTKKPDSNIDEIVDRLMKPLKIVVFCLTVAGYLFTYNKNNAILHEGESTLNDDSQRKLMEGMVYGNITKIVAMFTATSLYFTIECKGNGKCSFLLNSNSVMPMLKSIDNIENMVKLWKLCVEIDDKEYCASENGTFRCVCKPGFSGKFCEIFNACRKSKCLNGGICNTRLTVAECRCIEGFRGEFCEENIDDCESHQCQNGGTCIDRIQKYSCCCPPGYTGRYCEKKLTCFRNDCKNGGTCIVLGRSEKCVCLKGFNGRRCEINNQCRKNPCLNKGICVPSFPRYQCKCQPEFTGRKCAKQRRMLYALKFQPKSNHLVKIKDIPPLSEMTMSLFVKFQNSGISKNRETISSMKFEDKHSFISEGFALIGFPSVSLVAFKRTFALTYAKSDFWHFFVLMWDGMIDKIYVYWDGIEVAKDKTFQSKGITKLNSTLALGEDLISREESEPFVGAISQVNIWDTILPKEFARKKKCGLKGNLLSWDVFQSNIHRDVVIEQYVDLCTAGKHCNKSECYCYKQNLTKFSYGCELDCKESRQNRCIQTVMLWRKLLQIPWTDRVTNREVIDCNGGECYRHEKRLRCMCNPGFSGRYCEIYDACRKNKCLNGGTCYTRLRIAECRCIEGFRGKFCEENIDDCESHQCQNGGTCIDRIQEYSCCCLPGYTGRYCEKKLTCFRNDCKNGGTCIVVGRSEKCVCLKGFEGRRCEINNQCRKNPCLNKGICIPSFPRYQCKCQPEFTGKNCAKQRRMLYALEFPEKKHLEHLVKIDIPPLNELTMSFFVKFPKSGIVKDRGTIFSLRFEDTDSISKGFDLSGFPSVKLVAFQRTFLVSHATSDFWHSFVLMWDGMIDKIYVYWDGDEVAKDKTFRSKQITKLNSTLVLGQNDINEIDSEQFVGVISQVNIWDTILPVEFVSKQTCGLKGNVLSWDAVQSNIHGEVVIKQYVDLCKGTQCDETECYCYKQNLKEYETCLKHLDLCTSSLCLHGKCANTKMCECHEGFYGKFCQHKHYKCLINNGGCSHSCKSLFENVTCTCPPKMRLLSDEKTCAETERCVRGNRIYMNGDTWKEGCQTCTCYFTVLRCYTISCPKLKCRGSELMIQEPETCCSKCISNLRYCVMTNNRFQTFDLSTFTHKGMCQYALLHDCFEGKFSVRYEKSGSNTTQNDFIIIANCAKLKITAEGTCIVDDETIELPYVINANIRIVRNNADNSLRISTKSYVTFVWYSSTRVKILVNKTRKGKVCGLCGNFNDDQEDDRATLPSKLIWPSTYNKENCGKVLTVDDRTETPRGPGEDYTQGTDYYDYVTKKPGKNMDEVVDTLMKPLKIIVFCVTVAGFLFVILLFLFLLYKEKQDVDFLSEFTNSLVTFTSNSLVTLILRFNGTTCYTRLRIPECRCIEGFRGKFCEENIDDCESHQCQNGGTFFFFFFF